MKREPLRLLQTCYSRSWGGLEMQALQETVTLRDRGHQVWFACSSGSRLESEATKAGVRTVSMEVRGYIHPAAILHLARFFGDHEIQLVHCQLSRDLALVSPAIRLSRRRLPLFLSKRMGSYIKKKTPIHRFIYGNVSRVLAISEVIRRNVIETTPMNPRKVQTVHHGIDPAEFSPARANGQRVRNELGLSTEHIVVGMVGRFSPGKGHEEFLEAASLLRNKHPEARFLIVGEASRGEEEYAKRIRSHSTRCNLDEIVMFAGFRSDIRDVMASLDIFAFPSHAEAFGAVLIEAMALERPVVSTNCDGVLDIVVEGKTGLFMNPGKPEELADALDRLIRDPELAGKLGKAGRQRVIEKFDIRTLTTTIEDLYYEAIEKRG